MPRGARPARPAAPTAIAILGAAARLPGAPDLDALWRLLASGTDAVSTLPQDRFTQAAFLHPRRTEPGRSYTFAAGHLGDVTGFDAAAFGISPREAAEMDPQQRLLLEVTAEAIEDAGLLPSALAGQEIGVYVGGSSTDYAELRLPDHAGGDRYFMTGNALSILSNRLTNVFDLRGPGETIDTACSSSLVALHAACQAIAAGEVPAAIVAGVQMLLSPYAFSGFSRAGMLSPTGRCRVFDAAADGYVRAEGAGAVILKPLDAALRDGDQVRAVVLATGVNAAGRTIGMSLPNREAQARLIRLVMDRAGAAPERLGYFEAHGTGTQAGDPVEAWAIGTAAAKGRAAPLPVGSIKTNIGHLEPASGIAGLMKALLVLERRQVPPVLHQSAPNPHIDFAALNIRVPVALEALDGPARPLVGVNSFGFGGTNACALLAPAPPVKRAPKAEDRPAPPLILSAKSAEALAELAARWEARLEGATPREAASLARGAAKYRDLGPHRLVVRGGVEGLRAWRDGADTTPTPALPRFAGEGAGGADDPSPAKRGREGPARSAGGWGSDLPTAISGQTTAAGALCFVFSGNGAQYPAMARAALAHSAAFRAGLAAADAALAPLLGWSPLARIEAGLTAEELAATDIAQPTLFAIQAATLAALAEQGLRPATVLGHSVGEVAAAHAAGLLDLDAAARLVVARSRHQQRTAGQGRMAALQATPEEAAALIEGTPVEIAAFNAPAAVTLAGPAESLAALREEAERRRLAFVPLDLDYAFHSAAMEGVKAGLLADLAGLATSPPAIPMLSTVTGEAIGEAGPLYWWRNLRQPVRFEAAVRAAIARGARLFLEIGPNPVLQSYLRETARAAGVEAANLASLSKRDAEDRDPFPAIADRAVVAGADPRGGPAFAGPAERRLPLTPFARKPTWHARTAESTRLIDPAEDHRLLGFRRGGEPGLWSRILDTELEPWLADHKLGADAVLPAAAMLEMALAAARLRHPEAPKLEVAEFRILRPLTLEASRAREIRVTLDPEGAFRLESRRRLAEDAWTLHALGEARSATPAALNQPLAAAPAGTVIEGAAIRDLARRLGLAYGPAFASLAAVTVEAETGRALARLTLPASAPPDADFLLHPSRLDAALQGLFGLLADQPPPPGTGLVPVKFGRLVARPGAAPAETAEIALTRRGARSATARLTLRDAGGRIVARIEDAVFQRIALPGHAEPAEAGSRIELIPAAEGAAPPPALQPAIEAARDHAGANDMTEASLLLEAYVAAAAQRAPLAVAAPEAGTYQAFLRLSLVEDGAAESVNHSFRLIPDAALPPAEEIWQSVLAERPELALDLAWLAEAAERLPEALRGTRRNPPAPPLSGAAFNGLAEALAAAVAGCAGAWPENRPLRILEVGAGSDLLARRVLARLAPLGRHIRYTAAGATPPALPAAPPGVELAAIAWDPMADGAAPPPVADLVIGLAPSARSRAGSALAKALLPALAEGGALLLAEPTPGRAWTFVCGQDPEWWTGLADPAGGSDGGALPHAPLWLNRLAEAGWRAPVAEPLTCAPWPALLLAAEAPPPAAPAVPAPPRTLLVADAAALPLADALAARLSRRGGQVERLEIGAPPAPRALKGMRVVALLAPDAAALPERLAALTGLAESAAGSAAGFVLVTLGGAQPAEGRHLPEAAALLGLARVLANEMPALRPRRIDIAPDLPPDAAARRLAAELEQPSGEAEVTLASNARLVPRLAPGLALPPPGGRLALEIAQPGRLGTLRWAPATTRQPGPGEILLRIEAAGVNFRDLMWAQGLLPEEVLEAGFAGPTLGMEAAGVVEAAGPGVALRPGARVFGVVPGAFAAQAITRIEAVAPLPEGLSPEAAATIPVAFLTAAHALEGCAQLQPGESVLIHGGAGAVGLAALQVAQAIGARVAMSAGSPAKRAFLRAAGAELVLDSRDPGFADALRGAWPEGVDVVLNSLAGEAMERSLGLVKPFGRFLELGKRDFVENRRAPLRPLRRNASYFAIDVDELPRARPGLAQTLLNGIREKLRDGTYRPLPFAAFEPGEVEAAFRTLQASAHIGKLVIRPPAPSPEAAPAWAPPEGKVILVTGGTRGFGLAAAKWLARQGARHLALLGRKGGPGAGDALTELAALGAHATIHACDVADAAQLAEVLARLRAQRPIGGVVHAAGLLDDGAATALDAARFRRVLAPKLAGAENLDRLTAGDPLSLFLLFSSATTAFGNPGQANYVAANAALEALARRRRSAGRPALAVAWGPIADVGMLAEDGAKAETLNRRLGVAAMTAEEALSALPALLAQPHAAPMLVRLDRAEARLRLPIMAEPMLAALAGEGAAPDAGDLRARLQSLPPTEAEALVLRLAREEIGRILRLPAEAIGADAPVVGLGLDSLGALELRGGLEARLGVQVPIAALSEELTVTMLARQVTAATLAPAAEEQTIDALMESFEPGTARKAS